MTRGDFIHSVDRLQGTEAPQRSGGGGLGRTEPHAWLNGLRARQPLLCQPGDRCLLG